jgi:chromosome segregation ATPase
MPKETLASLQRELQLLREDFKTFSRELKDNLMPRSEINLRLAEVNKDIAQIKLEIVDHRKEAAKEMEALEDKISKRTWVTHTITAIFSVLITLAITYIFNDITRG